MSNFNFKAKRLKTGEVCEVEALDDYFGRHKYGYVVGSTIYTEEGFAESFEQVNHLT